MKFEEWTESMIEARKRWPEGPWSKEADRVEFKHLGFDCMMIRGPVGAWCGYVGVKKGHRWFGQPYDDIEIAGYGVHGGLTYSSVCEGHICHESDDDAEKIWWLGFDCAHGGDMWPASLTFGDEFKVLGRGHYWTEKEVTTEVQFLARKALEVA